MHIPVSHIAYKEQPVDILRLDMAGDGISGNKYFKLKYNLEAALENNFSALLTFGGAFSNHLHAVALAGKTAGLRTIGIVRGEDDPLNPTLQFVRQQGMHLYFISRQHYTQKNSASFLNELREIFGDFYLLPEGGTSDLAVKGCSEILADMEDVYDEIYCATGTGGMLAGIISTPGLQSYVTGISVLKGSGSLDKEVKKLAPHVNVKWQINNNYHMGGYAKYSSELMQFIQWFRTEYNILPDPVYTGKVFYAVLDMISKGLITKDKKILMIHSGGLQGWDGWNYRCADKMRQELSGIKQ